MQKLNLKAEKRELLGRKVKKLRREGLVPANVYGKKIKSEALTVAKEDFEKIFKEAGETGLIDLNWGEGNSVVLVGDVQKNPLTGDILHVDLRAVDLKEKITAFVPLVLVGESPAEKQGLGTAVEHLDEIEVEALPTDLPEKFELDKSVLTDVDMSIFVKDIKHDEKVKILTDKESIVVKVEPLQKIEEPEPVIEEQTIEDGSVETPSEEAASETTPQEQAQ